MTKDEALDKALDALEAYKGFIEDAHILEGQWHWIDGADKTITAIKQARSAPVQDSTCSEALRAQGKAYPRTCRKCGKGPCIALVNAALDKKAENARELGLDYEPVAVYGYCPVCGGKGVARERHPFGNDCCVNGHKYKSSEALTTPPAQPAPVPEPKPVCWDGEAKCPNRQACCDAQHCLYTTPPAASVQKPVTTLFGSLPVYDTPPVQEPVWIQPDHLQKAKTAPFLCRVEPHKRDDFVPLYTTPPAAQRQWVGISMDDIMAAAIQHGDSIRFEHDFARAIEAKLKEKNT